MGECRKLGGSASGVRELSYETAGPFGRLRPPYRRLPDEYHAAQVDHGGESGGGGGTEGAGGEKWEAGGSRAWYSGTSVREGTAICTSSTLSRQAGFSSRNFSNASSFCGMPLIMSSRSTPSITCSRTGRLEQDNQIIGGSKTCGFNNHTTWG